MDRSSDRASDSGTSGHDIGSSGSGESSCSGSGGDASGSSCGSGSGSGGSSGSGSGSSASGSGSSGSDDGGSEGPSDECVLLIQTNMSLGLKHMLRQDGFDIIHASTGREGLRIARENTQVQSVHACIHLASTPPGTVSIAVFFRV